VREPALDKKDDGSRFRANRGKLETWLREGLDIRFEHHLLAVTQGSHHARSSLQFTSGQEAHADLIVNAKDVNSPLRSISIEGYLPVILPLVAFSGSRRVGRDTFDALYRPQMQGSNILNFKHGNVRLNVSVSDYHDSDVSVRSTYSRPAGHARPDTLHRPYIPEEFYHELDAFARPGLPQPFANVIDTKLMRKEAVRHWLMRTMRLPKDGSRIAHKGALFW
jgi:hypothetical protein